MDKQMKYAIFTLLLLAFHAQAVVYKWVDENGNVHYSDTPVEGAIEVELKENTHNNVVLPPAPKLNPTTPEAVNVSYSMQIESPAAEATVRNNNGDFTVSASISPKPPLTTRYQLLLDGSPHGTPQDGPWFQLRGIDRGEHSIQVQALNGSGKVLATTASRIIYLHRAIARAPRPQPRSN